MIMCVTLGCRVRRPKGNLKPKSVAIWQLFTIKTEKTNDDQTTPENEDLKSSAHL